MDLGHTTSVTRIIAIQILIFFVIFSLLRDPNKLFYFIFLLERRLHVAPAKLNHECWFF